MNKLLKKIFAISFIAYLLLRIISYIKFKKYYTGFLDEFFAFVSVYIIILIIIILSHEIPKFYKDFKELSLNRKIVWIVIMTLLFIKLIFNIMKEIQ